MFNINMSRTQVIPYIERQLGIYNQFVSPRRLFVFTFSRKQKKPLQS